MNVTVRDVDVVARTIFGEARGETDLGKLAVAWVIVNRAKKYNQGLAETCLKSTHFSAWNNSRDHDDNQLKMMMADESDSIFIRCKIAAFSAIFRLKGDPTKGATHYIADYLDPVPSWAAGKLYLSIGRHKFYSGIA